MSMSTSAQTAQAAQAAGPTPIAASARLSLVTLTTDEIARAWPDLRHAFAATLPPSPDPDRMTRLLYACLGGDIQVHIAAEETPVTVAGAPLLSPRRRAVAVMATTVQYDWIEDRRTLFIYSLYGLADLDSAHVLQGWEALQRIARAKGCGRVAAVTKSDKITRMALGFGGEVEHHRVGVAVPPEAAATTPTQTQPLSQPTTPGKEPVR